MFSNISLLLVVQICIALTRKHIEVVKSGCFSSVSLRYHGRWIFKKNAKNLFFAVQIEKTEKNNLQKEWRKKLFYFLR